MLKTFLSSFTLALHNIRSQFFHTLLSITGIVIGVASLVAILSLIDGMEKFAQDQITNTTSLNTIVVRTEAVKQVNGISLRKDSITVLTYEDFKALKNLVGEKSTMHFFNSQAREVALEGDSIRQAAFVTGTVSLVPEQGVLAGRIFDAKQLEEGDGVAVLSESLAKKFSSDVTSVISKKIEVNGKVLPVTGIVKNGKGRGDELYVPITIYTTEKLQDLPPQCLIEAAHVEDVPVIKDQVVAFLNKKYTLANDFAVFTNEKRVEQAAKGFQLFRIIMGMIVGISVLVGGIGVMNVLLISVTERTVEIGIRKAVGANRRAIVMQFLFESITVSIFGSFVGVALGVLGTMAFVPIVKSLTHIPFQAIYTWNTFIVVAILAVVVGIVFGTYPAMRAARLDPVEAIRHE